MVLGYLLLCRIHQLLCKYSNMTVVSVNKNQMTVKLVSSINLTVRRSNQPSSESFQTLSN